MRRFPASWQRVRNELGLTKSHRRLGRRGFARPLRFEPLHCGIDDEWGVESFELMSAHNVVPSDRPDNYLLYPTGPFTADVADTIVNFTTGTLEDEQSR